MGYERATASSRGDTRLYRTSGERVGNSVSRSPPWKRKSIADNSSPPQPRLPVSLLWQGFLQLTRPRKIGRGQVLKQHTEIRAERAVGA